MPVVFSKSCQYGIRAVLFLAVHSGSDHKVGVSELAEALEVPRHFLAKILQQLSRHHIISSVKGPSGGFYLSEDNLDATLDQVVESIDGPEMFHSCILGLPECSSENPCPLHFQAYGYREGLSYQLRNQPIRELAAKIQREELKL